MPPWHTCADVSFLPWSNLYPHCTAALSALDPTNNLLLNAGSSERSASEHKRGSGTCDQSSELAQIEDTRTFSPFLTHSYSFFVYCKHKSQLEYP